IGGIALRRGPVSPAIPLVNRDRLLVDVTPSQRNHFADSKAGVDRHINHRGVRLLNQLDERRKLLWPNKRFVSSCTALRWRQLQRLCRDGHKKPVLHRRSEDAGKYVTA